MATTSGVYSPGLQADDVLTEAWERCGKSPAILTGDVAASARRSLQLMQIDWTNRGVNLWQVEKITVSLVAGQTEYVLPAEVADVLDAYLTIAGMDRYLGRISRTEYAGLPNKRIASPPSQIWIDRHIPAAVLVTYPAPDAAYTLTAYAMRQPQDVTALLQLPDAPALWGEALASGLAARLAEKFAPERFAEKSALAEKAWTAAHGENRERVPMTIMPDWSALR